MSERMYSRIALCFCVDPLRGTVGLSDPPVGQPGATKREALRASIICVIDSICPFSAIGEESTVNNYGHNNRKKIIYSELP